MPSTNDPPDDQLSILGPTLRFKGELHADEDLLVKGHIAGSITHSKHLTICREGRVTADINGAIVAVQGTVEGDVTATVSVAVLGGSSLTGDVRAPSISIVEGAAFNGSVIMDTSKSARAAEPSRGHNAPRITSGPMNGTNGR
jgi:cytoskeletal protein CcmA (bactofilin family)